MTIEGHVYGAVVGTGMISERLAWAVAALACVACSGAPNKPVEQQEHTHELLTAADCPAGTNIILGSDGNDALVGSNGNDCIIAGAGDDHIEGGNGNDVIFGGDGNDVILGGNGQDRVYGEAGDDYIDGGNANDDIEGGDGNDELFGANGDDRLAGGNGNDVLIGDNGSDTLLGGPGNDVLRGDNGDDTLRGEEGDDAIVRGNGRDVVSGGGGFDNCTGGADCEAPELGAARACSSDSQCASGEHCTGGVCLACLADSECDDGNVCRNDSCQPALGCRHVAVPNGTSCLDATVCDGAESCQSGSCTAGTPLTCDDGLFCNGLETCDARFGCQPGVAPLVPSDGVQCTVDRCNEDLDAIEHTPNDAACQAGFFCSATGGCQNIDECATGQNDCSVNATCHDGVPAEFCDDFGCSSAPPYTCTCNAGYEAEGNNCTPICDPLTVASGAERCVRARPNQTVDLRFSALDALPYKVQYQQADEPEENYCGATAVKNFLYWYGSDVDYRGIAGEMRTNSWDTGPIYLAVLAAGPLIGCVDPLFTCLPISLAISELAVKAGTLPGDLRAALQRRAPPGYTACIKSGDPSLETIRASLAEGNPVVYLESEGGNLHWAVITGLYDLGSGLRVRVANSDNRDWATFVTDWSLSPVGDDARRGILSALFGLNPYTMIRWIPSDQANGELCP